MSDWTGMFGSREAGLGRVSSFNRWASVKEGLRLIRRASYPWFEAEFSSIHRWKKEETFRLLAFRELRAQTYILKNSNDRWSFDERRTKKGYSPIVWSCIFIDTSVNFDVYHRVIRRRLGVDSSFTSGVRVRTTTSYTPSATITTSRRTVAVEGHGRRGTVL